MRWDLGDVWLDLNLRIKGKRGPFPIWRIGHPTNKPETTPAGVVKAGAAGGLEWIVDLQADKGVDLLGFAWKDEEGNAAEAPADLTVAYSTSTPEFLVVTDNGDGTGRADAVGVPGAGIVNALITTGGREITSTGLLNVVPGDAETAEMLFGDPTEVTPDV
jgi:hypothetical protein